MAEELQMILGDPAIFAIEFYITRAYAQRSILATGFFVVHVGGRFFGVREPDATALACSRDEVGQRVEGRGRHTAPFAEENAQEIAFAYRNSIYADEQESSYFGIAMDEFREYFDRNAGGIVWAPDGDAAFDDGSHILQFDINGQVRLIAFKSGEGWQPDLATIADIWLPASEFYGILRQCCDVFDADLANHTKEPIV